MNHAKDLATQIVKKLVQAGYIAYFAGGWVRDYLMKQPSSDVDIATDAPPEKILDLFPNTVHVGVAFNVVIVALGGHKFEVATFRKDIGIVDGRRPHHVEKATSEEDALRRDFTINGMFYDPLEDKIHDYVQGVEDISHRTIRTIGDPDERFLEDRLRMIRAVRFAARLGFKIDWETEEAIRENADKLFPAVSMERIWQEFNKMKEDGHFDEALVLLHQLLLLQTIFPELLEVHLNEIRHRVAPFGYYPPEAPTIAYIMALFQEKNGVEAEELCRYLRASNKDIHFIQIYIKGRELIKRELSEDKVPDLWEWSHFYSHLESEIILKVLAVHSVNPESFLYKHQLRQKELAVHIDRIRLKKPVVTPAVLQIHGISPGKTMGALLKQAERIAILEDRHHPEEVMEKLKQHPLWPKP